jgi:integrase/recombinase XerD
MPRSRQSLSEWQAAYLQQRQEQGAAPATVAAYRQDLQRFLAWAEARGLRFPSQLTVALLEAYQQDLAHSTLAPRTQVAALKRLQHWLAALQQAGGLLSNPALRLALPRLSRALPPEVWSVAEIEAILAQPDVTTPLGLRDRALLELLYACALRVGEVCRLQPKDLDLGEGWLWVREGKSLKDRRVPLAERAVTWLQRYLHEARPLLLTWARHEAPALFLSREGRALSPNVAEYRLRLYVRRALGQRRGSCHRFRFSVASLLLENGCDLRQIQAFLGHAHLRTSQYYARPTLGGLRVK